MNSKHQQPSPRPLHVELHPWSEWKDLANRWAALVTRCRDATFFVTAGWVETWLEEFGALLEPRFVELRDEDRLIGACALVRSSVRKGPFTIRRLYLNTSGEDDADSPCIEFNTLLCEHGYEAAVARALRDAAERLRDEEPWDELVADGIVEGEGLSALQEAFAGCPQVGQTKPSFYIDLDAVRRGGKPFLEMLSAAERKHVRHSIRKYSEIGELRFEQADNVDDAQRFLDELIVLHQRTWNERGFAGSFASSAFERFHRKLVVRCFPAGEIQLQRVRAGQATIGVLYNFVFRGKAYFYQCGYDYSHGKRFAPGMVAQTLAIQWAADHGLNEYDLMAGDVDYKRKLSSTYRTLHWDAWQSPGVKMKAFELLRKTKRRLAQAQLGETYRSWLARYAAPRSA